MTIQENVAQNPSSTEAEQQEKLNLIRQTFINEAFQHYMTLVTYLKSLPIPQQIFGFQKSLSYIDDGMLWVKEVLNACPIILPSSAPEPTSIAEIEKVIS